MWPSTILKTWVLNFKKNIDNSEIRKPEYLTDQKAEAVRRFLHDPKSKFIDLTDDDGNLKETIEKKEISSIKLIKDDEEEKKKGSRVWICDAGGRHPMTQGIYTDEFGKKGWRAECACPKKFQ